MKGGGPPVWPEAEGSTLGAIGQADVVVVATSTTLPSSQFADLAPSFLATDAIIQPVIHDLGLTVSRQFLFAKGYLRTRDLPGTTGIRVIGRARSPQLAAG